MEDIIIKKEILVDLIENLHPYTHEFKNIANEYGFIDNFLDNINSKYRDNFRQNQIYKFEKYLFNGNNSTIKSRIENMKKDINKEKSHFLKPYINKIEKDYDDYINETINKLTPGNFPETFFIKRELLVNIIEVFIKKHYNFVDLLNKYEVDYFEDILYKKYSDKFNYYEKELFSNYLFDRDIEMYSNINDIIDLIESDIYQVDEDDKGRPHFLKQYIEDIIYDYDVYIDKIINRLTFSEFTDKIYKEDKCVICFTNDSEIVFHKCGHQCICKTCSENEINKCPLCRKYV